MPNAGTLSHSTAKSDAASPTKRVTRSAFKTPPGRGIAPPRSPPGAPARPVRKLFLG